MPFFSHLEELRKRIVYSILAITIGFAICFHYSESILAFLLAPLNRHLVFVTRYPFLAFSSRSDIPSLVFLAPAEAFWVHMKLAFFASIFFGLPFLFYQVWKFVAPGLLPKEKRYAVPFVIVSTLLFIVGSAFCLFIVLPFALQFLLTYKTEHLRPMLSIGNYFDFSLKFLLAFGLIFELPLAMVLATRLGFLTPEVLARNRKYAILGNFILAAILTPTPDVFNQSLMAIPLCILYEVGIIASRLLRKKKSAPSEI
ncbi:MAG: twin-arginine translocase subunit TatC [candidate division NC10 bacterium]|nr:twin-arginine translocase subunit TatC [candidate division NC10 bacterium]